ncbi:E3 ubiquitin-protein ligase KEG [Bienertia sinuspersici]
MADDLVPKNPTPFEFVIYEGDAENMRTVIVTPNEASPWIDPSSLKLRHRIGRGQFGDVWLATHHRSAQDYDEYHEVAVKQLNLMKEDSVKIFLDKFADIFPKCHAMKGVCWLHGISVINGKISIVMKFYEGSVGDKLARSKEGKLSLPDVLRYGINLAQAIMELHSQDILVLNLRPSNFLLDENDQAILGDFGVSYLLLGLQLSNSDVATKVGSPNYMAPEQWEPDVRGPISIESDSWGYGCSILEMLTGDQPWCGRSVQQIYRAVVLNQEKPQIPTGLPPEIENVLSGCFEYDFRDRPLMTDILQAFKSSQDAIMNNETPFPPRSKMNTGGPDQHYHTEWFLSKDTLQEGDIVRSRKSPNSKSENMLVPEGKVVGLEGTDTRDGCILVKVHGIHDPLRVHASTLERVTHGFAAGDWARLREDQRHRSPLGILHSIHRDGSVDAGFIGGSWATGKITHIHPNGCLVVNFPGRLPFGQKQERFLADPNEVDMVSFSSCQGVVKKYQHLEDIHWAVRPILVSLGLFTAMKVGLFVGKKIAKPKTKSEKHARITTARDDQPSDDSGESPGFPLIWPQ